MRDSSNVGGPGAADGSSELGARLDDLLPDFDVESGHRIRVRAPTGVVYAAAREADLGGSPVARALFRLRGMPASSLSLRGLERLRFKPLIERPPDYFVLGLIGRFWTPRGHLVDFDPQGFADYEEPGLAKALWAFAVETGDDGTCTLTTLTRVRCMDPASRRWFRLYWTVIGPFSALIRKEMLRLVKRDAEATAAAGTPAGGSS